MYIKLLLASVQSQPRFSWKLTKNSYRHDYFFTTTDIVIESVLIVLACSITVLVNCYDISIYFFSALIQSFPF